MKRARTLLALTAIATSSLFVLGSGVAHATSNSVSDSATDSSPYDARGDIVNSGADYTNGNILLAAKTAYPVDPATDYNWVQNSTAIIWDIDTNGDGQEDYWAIVTNFSGVRSQVWRTSGSSPVCSAAPGFNASTIGVYTYFPASCIGSPLTFSIQVGSLYDTGSNTTFDEAPNNNGWCCSVSESGGSPTPPADQPPTNQSPATQPPSPTTTEPQPVLTDARAHSGYWMLSSDGSVYSFGDARSLGGAPNVGKATHVEPSPTGNGYWVLGESGQVATFGDATNLGSVSFPPGQKAVSLSATPSGNGYWVFSDFGLVAAKGDAAGYGSMAEHQPLNAPVVSSVATPTGHGYWMVAGDGGIFSFGDAAFHGSTGSMRLNKPVIGMAPSHDGSGYWLVASDGGIFAFDVPFFGSMGATHLNQPITGIVPGAAGYMMVAGDGGIFAFGNVAFHGSLGNNPPASPVVSAALQP